MELKYLSEMFPYQFYCIFLGHVGGVWEEVTTDGRPLASCGVGQTYDGTTRLDVVILDNKGILLMTRAEIGHS